MSNNITTLAAIRRAPHAVDFRALIHHGSSVQSLLDSGLIRKTKDGIGVFTVKAQRNTIDTIIEGVLSATLMPMPPPPPALSASEKAYLKLLRTFTHGVSPSDLAKLRKGLITKGFVKLDSRDTNAENKHKRYFTLKKKRQEIDSL